MQPISFDSPSRICEYGPRVRQILGAINFYFYYSVHSVFRRCKVMERAGNTDARVTRYYAQLYESASDEDVDVAGTSVKRTRIYDTVIKSFYVDPDCQPVDPTATQIDTIISAEQTNAPREIDLATPPTFTAPTAANDVTRAGYRTSIG
jgi:hypothetical protein